jgi:hypothetical protein
MGSPDAYGKSTSQNETKIFPAKGLTLKLMYGVSGIASILDAGAEVLQAIYRPTIEELAAQPFSNLGNYADAVMLKLRPVLCDEIQKIKPLPESRIDPDHPYSFKIQFAGYCNGSPVMTDRGLTLWSDKWCVTNSEPLCTACPGDYSFVGSSIIVEKLVTPGDDEFYQWGYAHDSRTHKQLWMTALSMRGSPVHGRSLCWPYARA